MVTLTGAASGGVVVTWTAATDAVSGVASYKVVHSTDIKPTSCAQGTQAYVGTALSTTIAGATSGTLHVGVCATDHAGNTSPIVVKSIVGRGEYSAPTGSLTLLRADGTSLPIVGTTAYTTSASIVTKVQASDNVGIARACVSNATTCPTTPWPAWAPTSAGVWLASHTLTTTAGTKTVRAFVADELGNTLTLSRNVVLDNLGPANGTVTRVRLGSTVTLGMSGFNDSLSGLNLSGFIVMARPGSTAPANCNATTESTVQRFTGRTAATAVTLSAGGAHSFRVCGTDNLGNIGSGVAFTMP